MDRMCDFIDLYTPYEKAKLSKHLMEQAKNETQYNTLFLDHLLVVKKKKCTVKVDPETNSTQVDDMSLWINKSCNKNEQIRGRDQVRGCFEGGSTNSRKIYWLLCATQYKFVVF